MQWCSPLFKLAVTDVLTSAVPLIGTIFSGSGPWSDETKQRSDVKLSELTDANRNQVPFLVLETLRKEARSGSL
jgi:nucleoside-triphosphatase THEP1